MPVIKVSADIFSESIQLHDEDFCGADCCASPVVHDAFTGFVIGSSSHGLAILSYSLPLIPCLIVLSKVRKRDVPERTGACFEAIPGECLKLSSW